MKTIQLIFFTGALLGATLARAARVWTSTDGRTLEADYVSASTGSVTVQRRSDAQKFTLSLASLSAADRDYVAKLAAWETTRAKKLAELQAAMPSPPAFAAHPAGNDCKQLWERYRSAVAFIRPDMIETHVTRLRTMVERDIARYDPDAHTKDANVKAGGLHDPTQSRAADTMVKAARENVRWLRGQFTPYLDRIAALTQPPV